MTRRSIFGVPMSETSNRLWETDSVFGHWSSRRSRSLAAPRSCCSWSGPHARACRRLAFDGLRRRGPTRQQIAGGLGPRRRCAVGANTWRPNTWRPSREGLTRGVRCRPPPQCQSPTPEGSRFPCRRTSRRHPLLPTIVRRDRRGMASSKGIVLGAFTLVNGAQRCDPLAPLDGTPQPDVRRRHGASGGFGRRPHPVAPAVTMQPHEHFAALLTARRRSGPRADAGGHRRRLLDAHPPVRRRRRLLDGVLPRPRRVDAGEADSRRHQAEHHRAARRRADDRQRHSALVRTAKALQQLPSPRSTSTWDVPRPSSTGSARVGDCSASRSASTPSSAHCATRCSIKFTVKTRARLRVARGVRPAAAALRRHSIDALTVHARTVAQIYRLPVHYDLSARPRDDAVSGHRQRPRALGGAGAGAAG